jgi:PTH1 family peptidyl-tRNA hydrolase
LAGYWDQEPGPVLVLGLGNPGAEYAGTRHNLGFAVTSVLADRHGLGLNKSGHRSRWGKGRVAGREVIIAQPLPFMNLSGEAARSLLSYFGLEPGRLITVHDDLDLPLGRLKVALKGGPGGHKGVASVIQRVGSQEFARLKVGIGRPRYEEPTEKFVLSGFYADQRKLAEETVQDAADCLEVMLAQGPQAAMQRFHRPYSNEEEEG